MDEVLATAGVASIADRKVGKCSGGEQQRLRFAMALLSDPALLILDEPTTGMDVEGRRGFWEAIRKDAERGRTVLFATHYLEEADRYADRVVLLSHGRIVADGTGSEIKALTSGRTVRATLPAPTRPPCAPRGVDSVEFQSEQVYVRTKDSDAVARWLLTQTEAHDLEITSSGLEDAFISLTWLTTPTRRPPHPPPPRPPPRKEPGDDRTTTASHLILPDRARPADGRLQPHGRCHRAQAHAEQQAHDHLHADLPGRDVLRLRHRHGHIGRVGSATSPPTSWSRWACTAPP